MRRIDPGKQYEYVDGQLTKLQKTQRPGHITVESYKKGTKHDIMKWRKEWKTEGTEREKERARQGMPPKIPWEERTKYDEIMKHLREKYGTPTAPAMPVIAYELPSEYMDSDGDPVELSPHSRFELFNKLWRTHKRKKSRIAKLQKSLEAQKDLHKFAGLASGTTINASARIAIHQDLKVLNTRWKFDPPN